MSNVRRVKLSKFLSLVLRHQPEAVGLTLDGAGWAEVDALLEGCRRKGRPITPEQLCEIVETSDKQRFEFSRDGLRIRASQGHSVQVDLGYAPSVPPEILYHGTAGRNIPSIRSRGLVKGNRHHVHLSPDYETAVKVGSRYGKAVVLEIMAGRMHARGFEFFISTNGVWLTEHVPRDFIAFPTIPEDGVDGNGSPKESAKCLLKLKSCGVILFREQPRRQFLLMKHPHRYDLPKGHLRPGESELDCALRELEEETGIEGQAVRMDPGFRFEHSYKARYRRLGGKCVAKTVVIFLGWLSGPAAILLTEHSGYEWVDWRPPRRIQAKTIDPLLTAVEQHWRSQEAGGLPL